MVARYVPIVARPFISIGVALGPARRQDHLSSKENPLSVPASSELSRSVQTDMIVNLMLKL